MSATKLRQRQPVNRLLAGLPQAERQRLLPLLKPVSLPTR